MSKALLSILALLAMVGLAAPAAAIDMDATFDPGALPSDFFYFPGGGVDPIANVADGVWTNNRAASEGSFWSGGAAAAATVVGLVYHGWSEIMVVDFGTSTNDDKTVFGMARHTDLVGDGNEYGFLAYFNNGNYSFLGQLDGVNTQIDVPVSNTDGEFHKYGWQIDEPTRTIKLYFDDVQVGEAAGYTFTGNSFGENLSYFGDATGGGIHHDIWDRVVAKEGAYPAITAQPGDFDGDGDVDGADFVVWQTHFPTASGATLADGDADGDGDVDGADFVVWQTNFPFTPNPGVAPVPEPATAGLALVALAVLRFVPRRSRRRES